MASVSSAADDKPGALALQHEALDVGGEVRVALEPEPSGHLDQHEAPVLGLVGRGHRCQELEHDGRRGLGDLGEQMGVDRAVGHHQDGLDGAAGLVRHQPS